MKARKSFRDCIVKPGETSPYAKFLPLFEPAQGTFNVESVRDPILGSRPNGLCFTPSRGNSRFRGG